MNPTFLKPADDHCWEEDRNKPGEEHGAPFMFNKNRSLSFEEQRVLLPIAEYKTSVLYYVDLYQTVIIVDDGGTGKSTQIPQYLLEHGWCNDNYMIGVTKPRGFSTAALAERIAQEHGCSLGTEVGYSLDFDHCYDINVTKIKCMPENMLIKEMMADPLLRKYSVIMLDDADERSVTVDILMGLLKKIKKKRKSLKLIVISSKDDAEELRDYFNEKKPENSKDTAAIIDVSGKAFPVTVHFLKEPTADYIRSAVESVLKIHEQELAGDILVFLTGVEEVEKVVAMLKENSAHSRNKNLKLFPVPMYGSLRADSQMKALRPTPRGLRKVVVTTSIAEKSVTVPDIVYVVDCGFVKLCYFDESTYTSPLITVPVSQDAADRRASKAGKFAPGKVFRLYTEGDYRKMSRSTVPEICRTDISYTVLQLKALSIHNVLRFPFPTRMPAVNLKCALEILHALGAIDDDGQLTSCGETMLQLPLPCVRSKMLLNAGDMGCTEEISSILAMMQVNSPFLGPKKGEDAIKAKVAKGKFEVHEGDLLTLLNVFRGFETHSDSEKEHWCRKHYLNQRVLLRAQKLKKRFLSLMERFGIPRASCDGNIQTMCRCITSGFFLYTAYLSYTGVYKSVRGGKELHIDPSSVLYDTHPKPEWIVYCDVTEKDKMYMKVITASQRSWLEELAPHFYQVAPINKDSEAV